MYFLLGLLIGFAGIRFQYYLEDNTNLSELKSLIIAFIASVIVTVLLVGCIYYIEHYLIW